MSKLGYTWYPKDWKSSDEVFQLNLTERGLYREMIDMAMLCQNQIDFNPSLWQRLFNVDDTLLTLCLNRLFEMGLILLDKRSNLLSVPSVQKRLKNVNKNRENGAKGGRPKKTKNNPNETQSKTQSETQGERQRERERERERESKKKGVPFELFWNTYGKKKNKPKAQKKWESFPEKTQIDIMAYLPEYVLSTPDVKFRKDPMTFFNNDSWNDEIIGEENQNQHPAPPTF